MKFAIIIPTWNRARILPRAIRSVLAQGHTDWALYIVDDGSTDETGPVVSPYLADQRIRYMRSSVNRGKLHSLNLALDRIEAGDAEWFTWMDDDDQLVAGCLETARKEIEKHPGFGMFLFSTVDTDGKSLARMEVSGPASYLRHKLVRKTVAGETHEFVATSCLNGARFNAPSTGAQKYWLGELSLRTGAVFCDKALKIKEFMEDGITRKGRAQGWRKRTEHRLRIDMFVVRHWLGVIRTHPRSLAVYQVWSKALARAVGRGLRLRFTPARSGR